MPGRHHQYPGQTQPHPRRGRHAQHQRQRAGPRPGRAHLQRRAHGPPGEGQHHGSREQGQRGLHRGPAQQVPDQAPAGDVDVADGAVVLPVLDDAPAHPGQDLPDDHEEGVAHHHGGEVRGVGPALHHQVDDGQDEALGQGLDDGVAGEQEGVGPVALHHPPQPCPAQKAPGRRQAPHCHRSVNRPSALARRSIHSSIRQAAQMNSTAKAASTASSVPRGSTAMASSGP